MDKEKILEGMSYVDPALVEAADAAPCRRKSGWHRPALIAACLCLALAGTAVAMALGLDWTFGGPVTFPEWGEFAGVVEVWSPEHLPVESLSREARDLAADTADGTAAVGSFAERVQRDLVDPETGETVTFYDNTYRMENWDELERFLGVDVLPENPVLRDAISTMVYVGDTGGHCFLMLHSSDSGELLSIGAMGGFNTTYDTASDNSTVTIQIRTNARTDANPYNNGGGLATLYRTEEDLTQAAQEEYTTPSGLPCLLTSTENGWEGYFCYGAFVVDLKAQGGDDVSDQDVRAELVRVLDAFQ